MRCYLVVKLAARWRMRELFRLSRRPSFKTTLRYLAIIVVIKKDNII